MSTAAEWLNAAATSEIEWTARVSGEGAKDGLPRPPKHQTKETTTQINRQRIALNPMTDIAHPHLRAIRQSCSGRSTFLTH